ncbi:MAG: DUF3237 domain-containing protein [Candidatus Binatia bacterium]
MKIETLMTYRATLKEPIAVGPGPWGTRLVYDVTGGEFEGPKLRGRLLASGADWLLVDSNGVGRLDVRATLETDDGAFVYLRYPGVVVINDVVSAALEKGLETQFGDTYFFTQPRFESGDDRYLWLNSVVAVAEGRLLPNAVEYRVYQLGLD